MHGFQPTSAISTQVGFVVRVDPSRVPSTLAGDGDVATSIQGFESLGKTNAFDPVLGSTEQDRRREPVVCLAVVLVALPPSQLIKKCLFTPCGDRAIVNLPEAAAVLSAV